jgi:GrpB-like predicted nucleotidyltransferase (UPF0157 family)
MLGVPKYKVVLEKHNEEWAEEFEKTKQTLINIHGDNIVDIQHVGSTAIKGIVAKPMLDIAIILKTITKSVFNVMKENRYDYYGEVIPGKHLFILRGGDEVSLQHIHCYEEKNCDQFFDQIRFRDFIRSHSEFAKEYELLKQELYKMYSDDRKKYTEGKQAFFDKIKQLADENYTE